MIKLSEISAKVRQIAVKNIGRDKPTLLISNDVTTPGKNLFARYAERMIRPGTMSRCACACGCPRCRWNATAR
jgi:hypothetical protein